MAPHTQPFSFTPYPVIGCLVEADKMLKQKLEWTPINSQQKEFLENSFAEGREEVPNIEEIKGKASFQAEEINRFLKNEGFDIKLSPLPNSQSFSVASILKVLEKWIKKGQKTTVQSKNSNESFPAVQIDDNNVSYWKTPKDLHNEIIIQLHTKNEDSVYLTICDNPKTGFELLQWIREINKNKKFNTEYGDCIFPMIDYDMKEDLSWIVGMKTATKSGNPYDIYEAIQQTKFRMNEIGAKVESAAAMTMRCTSLSIGKETYIIDKPFLIWIERNGLSLPFFIGYLTEDVWKEPKEL